MKKLALPLVITCTGALVALKILLSAIQTQQPDRITAAAIPCFFVALLVHQIIKLRTKHLRA